MLKFVLLSALIFGSVSATAVTCEEAMLNAGYDKTLFKMQGSDTIEILPRRGDDVAYLRSSLNIPECNIISKQAKGLGIRPNHPEESVEIVVNNIEALNIGNFGTLKANNIIVSTDGVIQENKKEKLYCSFLNSKRGIVETKTIDINCEMATSASGLFNKGTIKAEKIKSITKRPDPTAPDATVVGTGAIVNGTIDEHPATILTDTIEGIGRIGIINFKNASIHAQKVHGSAPDKPNRTVQKISMSGIDNWGDITADVIVGEGRDWGIWNAEGKISGNSIVGKSTQHPTSIGIENSGIIEAKSVECCGGKRLCYRGKIDNQTGKISAKPENICSKLPAKTKK